MPNKERNRLCWAFLWAHTQLLIMKTAKPVIFLDFEGVLNTKQYASDLRRSGKMPNDEYGYLFDPMAVNCLREIITEKDVDIVVTSSWRNEGLEKLRKMWNDRNMPGRILDITPFAIDKSVIIDGYMIVQRGYEIKQWLRDNGRDRDYIIIDDQDDFLPEQHRHIVRTDKKIGLSHDDAQAAIKKLV